MSLLQGSFAKETYNFIDPTNQSHPIRVIWLILMRDMTHLYVSVLRLSLRSGWTAHCSLGYDMTDVYVSFGIPKETYISQKRCTYVKRDPFDTRCVCLFWYSKRDIHISKAMYICPKRPIWHEMCVPLLVFMSHTWHTLIRVWHETWLIHVCDMTRSNLWHDSIIRLTWFIHVCDTTHSIVWHYSFICVTWLIHVCDTTHSYVWHDSFICVTWLIHVYDMTHSNVWHCSFICVTWLIHMCDMTHSCAWHDSSMCFTWFAHMRDMTHSYVWHDSFIFVTWLIHMCDMPHSNVWHDSFICVTRLIHVCDMTH